MSLYYSMSSSWRLKVEQFRIAQLTLVFVPLQHWSWQNDSHSATSLVRPVHEFEGSTVCFCDLSGKNETDTTTGRFCCVKRNKRVAWIQQARAVIFDGQVHNFFEQLPANNDGRLEPVLWKRVGFVWTFCGRGGFQNRFGRVPHQIDQHLFELIRIYHHGHIWSGHHLNFDAGLQSSYARHQWRQG